jgi:hypothetical protein
MCPEEGRLCLVEVEAFCIQMMTSELDTERCRYWVAKENCKKDCGDCIDNECSNQDVVKYPPRFRRKDTASFVEKVNARLWKVNLIHDSEGILDF